MEKLQFYTKFINFKSESKFGGSDHEGKTTSQKGDNLGFTMTLSC